MLRLVRKFICSRATIDIAVNSWSRVHTRDLWFRHDTSAFWAIHIRPPRVALGRYYVCTYASSLVMILSRRIGFLSPCGSASFDMLTAIMVISRACRGEPESHLGIKTNTSEPVVFLHIVFLSARHGKHYIGTFFGVQFHCGCNVYLCCGLIIVCSMLDHFICRLPYLIWLFSLFGISIAQLVRFLRNSQRDSVMLRAWVTHNCVPKTYQLLTIWLGCASLVRHRSSNHTTQRVLTPNPSEAELTSFM